MSNLSITRDEQNARSIMVLTLDDRDSARVRLDQLDRAVIDQPAETIADMLLSLEILFRRLNEQFPHPSYKVPRR